jgi:two-component system cell cycle sensor histidine kinase/response regulator CckA
MANRQPPKQRSTAKSTTALRQTNESLTREIAALELAQEELKRSEQELSDFFDNAAVPVHWVGPDGIILRANQAELNALGYSADEYIGHPIAEFHVEPAVIDDILARLVQGETLHDYEARMRAKDGSIKHVAISSNVMWKNGKFIHTRSLTRDITNRRRVERRIAAEHAVTRILADSRTLQQAAGKLLQAIGESLEWQIGVFWIVEEHGDALRCLETWHEPSTPFPDFEAACRSWIFVPDIGLPGRIWKNRRPVWIPDVIKDSNFPRAPMAARDDLHGAFGFPVQFGDRVFGVIEFLSRRIRHPNEALLQMVEAIGSEIGQFLERLRAQEDLLQSEEKLRQQAQELEQQLIASGRLVSLGELTASMAHEFNNPLGIIIGFAQDLLSETDSSSQTYRSLKIIEEESHRCEKIIRELLQFARPGSAEFQLTDIRACIGKSLNLVSNYLYKQKIEAVTHIEENLPKVEADPLQLEQVLVNLYLNAIDAMLDGGKLCVTAALEAAPGDPSRIAITVTDTGFGIHDQDLSRIFQPFYSAKKKKGLGLGLPICERIIKNHGGRIQVQSQPAKGTTFNILLPLEQAPAP